jgi:hypothetical protein
MCLMIRNSCPACGSEIPPTAINIKQAVALCPTCGKLSSVKDVLESDGSGAWRPGLPEPSGVSITHVGSATTIQASGSSKGAVILVGAIALFWNSGVMLFLTACASGLYSHYIGPLPAWAPDPEISGESGPGRRASKMSLGQVHELCLFMVPFVLIGIGLMCGVLVLAFGKVRVAIDGDHAAATSGWGVLRWKKRFDPGSVRRVFLGHKQSGEDNHTTFHIQIEADRRLEFGGVLSPERRDWMIYNLRERLLRHSPRG